MDPRKRAVKIQIAVGNEGLKRINISTLDEEGQKDPAKLYKLFEHQLDVHLNFRIHRMELNSDRMRQFC